MSGIYLDSPKVPASDSNRAFIITIVVGVQKFLALDHSAKLGSCVDFAHNVMSLDPNIQTSEADEWYLK
jgi:hypothetical protein